MKIKMILHYWMVTEVRESITFEYLLSYRKISLDSKILILMKLCVYLVCT